MTTFIFCNGTVGSSNPLQASRLHGRLNCRAVLSAVECMHLVQGRAVDKQLTNKYSLTGTGVTTDKFTPLNAGIMSASAMLYLIIQVLACCGRPWSHRRPASLHNSRAKSAAVRCMHHCPSEIAQLAELVKHRAGRGFATFTLVLCPYTDPSILLPVAPANCVSAGRDHLPAHAGGLLHLPGSQCELTDAGPPHSFAGLFPNLSFSPLKDKKLSRSSHQPQTCMRQHTTCQFRANIIKGI